jgi:uncharacterized protein (TIGR03067 family)
LLRLPAVEDNAAMEADPPKAEPPKRKRRWFQFSLRTLVIFTLIALSVRGIMNTAIRLLLTVMIVLAAGTARADDAAENTKANKAELEKLRGKWKLVSVVDHGQEDETLTKRGAVFAFENDSLTITGESKPATEKYTIRLDSNTNPKLLDVVKAPKGPDGQNRVVEGVYTLDGDILLWCFNLDGNRPAKANRPAAVESKADTSAVLFKFKRIRD